MINLTLITNGGRVHSIVPETNTIREILDENDIDYSVGTIMVNGMSFHNAGDLDRTLEDWGCKDRATIGVVAKVQNAAKLTATGNAAVLTSAIKLEDLKLIEKYKPEALTLTVRDDDNHKVPVFRAATTKNAYGSVNKNGVCFAQQADANGFAIVTMAMDFKNVADPKDELEDAFGSALARLNELEQALAGVTEEIGKERDAVREMITVA